jgi:hypothetical protein
MKIKITFLFLFISTVVAFAQLDTNGRRSQDWQIVNYRMSDFDTIKKMGFGMDFLIGGMSSGIYGDVSNYLSGNGGIKMDFLFRGNGRFSGGFNFSAYGSERKKAFPIPNQQQSENPTLLTAGVSLNNIVYKKNKQELSIQLDLNYFEQQYIGASDDVNNRNRVSGFSPGFFLNYSLQLGRDGIDNGWGYWGGNNNISVVSHYINFHVGTRIMNMNMNQGDGFLFEVGIAYKLRMQTIRAFRLKEGVN